MNKSALDILHPTKPSEAYFLKKYSTSSLLKYLKLYQVNKVMRGNGD
ncbi:MAG: hypothetical protein QNL21_08280 [Flavobacteriales bacterium]